MKILFKTLGATEKEMQTYLKMLELGAQPVSVMAKYVGMPRSSMYAVLERLKSLHLIEEFDQHGLKYIRCIPVKMIKDLLQSKRRMLQQAMNVLEEKLP